MEIQGHSPAVAFLKGTVLIVFPMEPGGPVGVLSVVNHLRLFQTVCVLFFSGKILPLIEIPDIKGHQTPWCPLSWLFLALSVVSAFP